MLKIQLEGQNATTFTDAQIEDITNQLDILNSGHNNYSIIYNHKSYEVSILNIDADTKTLFLKIDNIPTSVKISDKMDLILEKLGIDASKSQKLTVLKAPMPGLVVEWSVKEGDSVNTGDKLLILEAMKMENVIKATGEGVIKKLHVSKGVAVEKNQLLIDFV